MPSGEELPSVNTVWSLRSPEFLVYVTGMGGVLLSQQCHGTGLRWPLAVVLPGRVLGLFGIVGCASAGCVESSC